jgi:hypothetical protein
MNSFILFFIILQSAFSYSTEIEHELMRKIAVFPIFETENSAVSEDAWWQIREALTRDKKLLIASKRFMVNRGVFQARKTLRPADAIILGKLLDADVLIVSFMEERHLKMKAYDAENGYLLWEGESPFHPAISVDDQMVKNSEKLVADFLKVIPYHGFTLYDEAHDKVLTEKAGKYYAKIFVGGGADVEIGDAVQWITLQADAGKTLLKDAKSKMIADGVITELEGDDANLTATVELQNLSDPDVIQENTLIRFPKELAKLRDLFAREAKNLGASQEYLSHDLRPVASFHKETQASATGFAFFFSLVGFILLAF